MSREIKVFTACEQEDLTWQLAWCLADDDREAKFKEDWLEYECTDAVSSMVSQPRVLRLLA